MNKQYLMIFGGGITVAALAFFISVTRSEVNIANDNFNKLSLQSMQQTTNITDNGKMVKQLLDKLSALQEQNLLSAPVDSTIEPTVNAGLDQKLTKLSVDLGLLKKQLKGLKETKSQPNTNLPTAPEIIDSSEDFLTARKTREEKMKAEIEKMESTYEAALYQGEADASWTTDIETTLGDLISAKTIGDDVHLQNVECSTDICKVNLSHSDQTTLNDSALLPALGNVTVYLNKADTAGQGQKGYVMYISADGRDLPPVERL